MTYSIQIGDRVVLPRQDLHHLFTALQHAEYELIAPIIREGVIVYDTVTSVEEFILLFYTSRQQRSE